mgnify:CR=1 FL=1
MITLVLTNRDRDLRIVQKCLNSLSLQSSKEFKVFVIDYGSEEHYLEKLKELIKGFTFVELIICPVQGQLWNKSRAINITLRKTISPYFLVGDIDLMFHPDFIQIAKGLANPNEVHYFQYGFLSLKESLTEKEFETYEVDFKGNNEVTGTTLFPTETLMGVHGYDEFYHGWGAEDTDIHLRMKNLGMKVKFYDSEILLKHQWHPKAYRSKLRENPFHSLLERINHSYMTLTDVTKRTIVNKDFDWGKEPLKQDHDKLTNPDVREIFIKNSKIEIASVLSQFRNFKDEVIFFRIQEVQKSLEFKNQIKRVLKKKHISFIEMEEVNNLLLEEIIKNYRNLPYQFSFDRNKKNIELKIYFN